MEKDAEKHRDKFRKRAKKHNRNTNEYYADPDKPTNDELETQQEWDGKLMMLPSALKNLKPDQRKILQMIFGEGKSYEEVGKVFGVSKMAICYRLQTILKKLKTFF
jgi:RNA polymerase sigma factor (sigma-70 family)